jgi:hypothetical protein
MNTFGIVTFAGAAIAAASIEDVKVALMAMAVMLIPSVGFLIKIAIESQTQKLLAARRATRRDDPPTEEPEE